MPSNRWLKRPARALRDLATRAHMRAGLLPRLPFVIALVASMVALVAAIEHRPATDARVASVEELRSFGPEDYDDASAWGEEEVELEIVEYGFSRITDADGQERVIAAVVLANPHDGSLVPGGLAIQTETERGYPVQRDSMYVGSLPPRSTVAFGYVMESDLAGIELDELSLRQTDPSLLFPVDAPVGEEWLVQEPLPRLTVTGLEPLVSPEGYRVHYRAEAAGETWAEVAVLFRDGEGTLLGGFPADGYVENVYSSLRTFPAGVSDQYVDLPAGWIPEGADLDRIEIGPSRY